MKKIFYFLALLVGCLVFVPFAHAADLSSGDMISVEKTQKNPLIFSNSAKIKSDVQGDLSIFAGDIQVDNSVENSAYLFGGTVNVKAPEIGNRLVVGAGDVKVASHIKGDLIMFGGNVTLENSNIVDGDIYVYGGNLYLRGKVAGAVKAGGGKIFIEDFLADRDVTLQSDGIIANENSKVNGVFKYYASKPAELPSSLSQDPQFIKLKKDTWASASSIIGGLMMLALLAVILVLVQKKTLGKLMNETYNKFGSKLLAGLIIMIAVPFIILILLMTYVGILTAVGLGILYAAAWVFAYAYGSIFIGSLLVKWLSKGKEIKADWNAAVLGSLAVGLVNYIPIIGPLAVFIISLVGLGIAYSSIKLINA